MPIAPPVELNSSSPVWADATTYQYGPDPMSNYGRRAGQPDRQAGPDRPRRRLPPRDSADVVPYAQFDTALGTTVVSIGYRLLDDTPWPAPVDDIAEGLDDGFQLAQALTGGRISDVTETGLSAGGTALALINYSPDYPTTTVRPDRIITVSAPLMTDAVSPGNRSFGFRYTDACGGTTSCRRRASPSRSWGHRAIPSPSNETESPTSVSFETISSDSKSRSKLISIRTIQDIMGASAGIWRDTPMSRTLS